MRRILVALFAMLLTVPATAAVPKFNWRPTTQALKSHDSVVQLADDTDRAVAAMIKLAAWELRQRHLDDVADNLEAQQEMWKGYLPRLVTEGTIGDIGDHDPYSVWLSVVYEVLRYYLGDEVMHLTHLEDIYIVNFAVVVVFNPAIAFDETDYLEHWTPFFGVVAYWSIWIGCEVGTYGTGWFLICTPAGEAGKFVTVKWIAPPIGDRVYNRWLDNH